MRSLGSVTGRVCTKRGERYPKHHLPQHCCLRKDHSKKTPPKKKPKSATAMTTTTITKEEEKKKRNPPRTRGAHAISFNSFPAGGKLC